MILLFPAAIVALRSSNAMNSRRLGKVQNGGGIARIGTVDLALPGR